MDKTLLDDIDLLNNCLNTNEDIIFLKKLETEMENDNEVKVLAYKFDMAQIEYSDSLKHQSYNKDIYFKNMINSYKDLNQHPKVIAYNKQYEKVKKIYDFINDNLFGFLKE